MKEKFIKGIEMLKKIDEYVEMVDQIKTESIINRQDHTAEMSLLELRVSMA